MVRLLRLPDVIAQTGYRRSRLYELVRSGKFPRPVSLGGGRAVAWPSSEIDAWIADRIRASREKSK